MSKARLIADLLADDGTVKVAPTTFEQDTVPTSGYKLGDLWYDPEDAVMAVCIKVEDELQWKEL